MTPEEELRALRTLVPQLLGVARVALKVAEQFIHADCPDPIKRKAALKGLDPLRNHIKEAQRLSIGRLTPR